MTDLLQATSPQGSGEPTRLSAERVRAIFLACLFKPKEDTSNAVLAEGIVNKFGFHPERLASHADEIRRLLLELPDEFLESKGGGWSFLNACMDRHGEQWAEHPTMEQLFALGIATGVVSCQFPRDMWSALPGGVPYYCVKDV